MTRTDSLRVEISGDRGIVMTRSFAAPRQLVFDAFTKPELVKQWLFGPSRWMLAVCDIDLRPGGTQRYVWRRDDGKEMGMTAVYREIAPPERLVQTERFDDAWYPGEALGTTEFVEEDGETTVVMTMLYESREARDNVLKTGMADGMATGYDRLAKLLASVI